MPTSVTPKPMRFVLSYSSVPTKYQPLQKRVALYPKPLHPQDSSPKRGASVLPQNDPVSNPVKPVPKKGPSPKAIKCGLTRCQTPYPTIIDRTGERNLAKLPKRIPDLYAPVQLKVLATGASNLSGQNSKTKKGTSPESIPSLTTMSVASHPMTGVEGKNNTDGQVPQQVAVTLPNAHQMGIETARVVQDKTNTDGAQAATAGSKTDGSALLLQVPPMSNRPPSPEISGVISQPESALSRQQTQDQVSPSSHLASDPANPARPSTPPATNTLSRVSSQKKSNSPKRRPSPPKEPVVKSFPNGSATAIPSDAKVNLSAISGEELKAFIVTLCEKNKYPIPTFDAPSSGVPKVQGSRRKELYFCFEGNSTTDETLNQFLDILAPTITPIPVQYGTADATVATLQGKKYVKVPYYEPKDYPA